MSDVKRSGLKPLRSSTNIINNKSETRLGRGRTPMLKNVEPKVSQTEQEIESSTPTSKSFKSIVSELNSSRSHRQKFSTKKTSKPTTSIEKRIKKAACRSAEKKKVKKAIQTILSRDQRIKRWLTSKEPVEDSEYWRLQSERLGNELTEQLDHLDELELDNELLIAEFEQMSKLAENAHKLSRLLEQIGHTTLNTNGRL